MHRITRFTLAVLVMMMTAVVPQSMQAQSSERSIPPGISINNSMMRGGTNLSASGINASPLLAQNGEKIVTKTPSSTPIVYIGETPLTIPTVADGKMYYYTYSDANGLGNGSIDGYNVAVSKAEDGTLNLTFKDLTVEKNHQYEYVFINSFPATAAVYITYNGKTILTLEGNSSLTDVEKNPIMDYSSGLVSEGITEIRGEGLLTATGAKAKSSYGLWCSFNLALDLNGGSLTATGSSVVDGNSYGIYVHNQLSIQGNSEIVATGKNALYYSTGIFAGGATTIDLDGGSLTAKGGEAAKHDSFGFQVERMTIQGNGSIIATSSKAKEESTGLHAANKLTVALDGGSLTASGGESASNKSVGVASYAINISSGTMIAQGHTTATRGGNSSPLAPTIYTGAKVLAGSEYDGSNAGVYDASKIGTYKYLHVENPDLKDATIDAIPNQAFTGFAITPKPVVKYGDETLVEGKDYTVSYANNVDPGTATITINGIGNFIGTLTVSFTINPEQATDYAYVNLPFVTGISTNPIAGTYSVTKGESFTFTITLKEGYEESKPIVTANRKEITPNEAGEYVIEKITENIDITITGISATGIEGISAKTAIWTSGHSLNIRTARPQQLQVISILGKSAIARNIPAGDTSIGTLSAGIYVVRLADGTMEKVIIR